MVEKHQRSLKIRKSKCYCFFRRFFVHIYSGTRSETFSKDADYFHIITNNTIYGTRYTKLPETGKVPLVADTSSNILSEKYDVSKFGLIYAGAQKNMGPAGGCGIIREDLVTDTQPEIPTMLKYKIHVESRPV